MSFFDGWDVEAVLRRVVAEEELKRKHLVIALTGAHSYGFLSFDSDYDLKAIHIDPTTRILGLKQPDNSHSRMETIDSFEIDYTSNEIRQVILGILAGNGSYIERVLGSMLVHTSPQFEEFRVLVKQSLSQRVYNHYRGFAVGQRKKLEEAESPSVKKLLYTFRTALTGIHMLLTGELEADLRNTAAEYGYTDVFDWIDVKRSGEKVTMCTEDRDKWRPALDSVFAELDIALVRSCLPPEPPNRYELETFLLQIRMPGIVWRR